MSVENLAYLSSRQGLHDLAHFMAAMNTEHGITGNWYKTFVLWPFDI